MSWLLGAVSCSSSLSGRWTEVDLSSTTLSQLSEVAHLTSHILGPAFRSLLLSIGRTQQQFHYSL